MAAAEDYLKQIADRTVRQFERTCQGVQKLSVTSTAIVTLTPTSGATSAIVFVEADASNGDLTKAVRILETSTVPVTTSLGFILGDGTFYELVGGNCIGEFQAIGIQSGKTQTITVQYYH